jgi:hypothetical protein
LKRERLERRAVLTRQTVALLIEPVLELGGVGEEDPVQKRAVVERDGAGRLTAGERQRELLQVGSDDCGVESEVVGPEKKVLGIQIAPEAVKSLLENPASAILVAFWPEIREQPVTAHPLLSSGGE